MGWLMLGCTYLDCNLFVLVGSWLMFVCLDVNYNLIANDLFFCFYRSKNLCLLLWKIWKVMCWVP